MGYESKIYVLERIERKDDLTDERDIYSLRIAEFDLCKLGYSKEAQNVYDAFKTEVDFPVFYDINNDGVYEDCYGEICKYSHIPELLEALRAMERAEHYRRLPPIIKFLEGINEKEWEHEIVCVHYGY